MVIMWLKLNRYFFFQCFPVIDVARWRRLFDMFGFPLIWLLHRKIKAAQKKKTVKFTF